jgi:hypothetical protein
MRNLQFGMSEGGALLHLDHTFAAALVDLMHATTCPEGSAQEGACCQAGRIDGRKAWFQSHAFSKRKKAGFGIFVDMVRRIGVWSEVGLGTKTGVGSGLTFGTGLQGKKNVPAHKL